MFQVRHGLVSVSEGSDAPRRARLRLTEDHLIVQREELVYTHTSSAADSPTLTKVSPQATNHQQLDEIFTCTRVRVMSTLYKKVEKRK